MSIYKRGKSWYIDTVIAGKRIHRKAGNTKKEASEVDAGIQRQFKNNKLPLPTFSPLVAFDFAAIEYLKYCKTTKSGRTFELEDTDYKKHLAPFFMKYALHEVNNEVLKTFQGYQHQKGYADRTCNIHMGLVRKIINNAIENKWIAPSVKLKYPMYEEHQKLHSFLSPDEMKHFIDHFCHGMSYRRSLFGICTGLRPKELTYLSPGDVDLKMKVVRIVSKPPHYIIKTKKQRTIPLNKTALKIAQELITEGSKRKWLFSDTDKPIKNIRRSISTAARRAGISKHITPNMLRHTFATHALINGADIKSVSEILGHSDIKTTMKYLHSIKEQLRKTVDVIEIDYQKFDDGKKTPHKSPQSVKSPQFKEKQKSL